MNLNSAIRKAFATALLLLNAVFASLATAASSSDLTEDAGFSIKVTREPTFPLKLKTEGYTDGRATLQILVDQFGELRDALVIEATHPDFGKAVIDVIDRWEFGVPRLDGEAVPMAQNLQVHFEATGNVLSYSTGAELGLLILFDQITKARHGYRIARIDEIDSIPVPVHIEKPSFPAEMLKGEKAQRAVFEFFIDESGSVRIPTLRENESTEKIEENLLVIAQDALMKWKFQVPTKNGKPVVVRVAQPITFTNSTVVTAKTP